MLQIDFTQEPLSHELRDQLRDGLSAHAIDAIGIDGFGEVIAVTAREGESLKSLGVITF